uniref:Putative glycosyltransferase n=1 Tax=viral metagenome TaxID=1070528 RepID=A0A6M3LD85_9ZZZZ
MKISIIIPVHKTESVMHITKTLDGIKRTIGIPEREYTITLVGTLPEDVFKKRMNSNWTFLPTTALLGNAKNQGAEYSISQYDPDVLVFMDAHMNFYDNYSANWGRIIYDFLMNRPGTVVAPAISIYDQPLQRGYGVISDITEDNKQMDLKWKWVGTPPANNSPFEVPGLCGCFMAMTPQTFADSLIGFTPPLAIDDREFSLRIWILGKNMYVIPSLAVGHRFAAGYSDFSKERGIDWGTGMLLYVFLNMDRETMMRLYEKGIWSSPDKRESLRRATTMYWQQVRNRVQSKKVRTAEQYFKRFASL